MASDEGDPDDVENSTALEFVTADVDTTCSICYAEFLDKEDLDIHVKQVHKGGSHPCQFCPETYTDLLDYAVHFRDNHIQDVRCCRYCSKVIKGPYQLSRHQKLHTSYSASYLSCSQCESLFQTQNQLELHEKNDHKETPDCFFLPCMVYLSAILNSNAANILQGTVKSFICNTCRFTSADLKSYKAHIMKGKCTSLFCDHCSTIFKYRKNLINHIRRRKTKCDQLVDGVKCINCNIAVHHKNLRQHLEMCNKIKCAKCNVAFDSIDQLSIHQSKEHPQAIHVTMQCKFCTKIFVGKGALKKHIMRSHQPSFHLYKYMCKTCGSIFPHPQKLFAHYFLQHRELQPYTCKLCDKTFRIRKRFTLHIKLEHKSKGYVQFDENYQVYFTETKPEKPFIPKCVIDEATLFSPSEDEQKLERPKRKCLVKRKISKPTKTKKALKDSSSDDDEPLHKMTKMEYVKESRSLKNKRQFTCKVCRKYCYTFQNYTNHMSLHKKSENVTCVKCNETFKSVKELQSHTTSEHSSSLLTETLKKVLEKRKSAPVVEEETVSQKFSKTIKKVKFDRCFETAKITPAPNKDISVRKFIEDFSPELTAEGSKVKIESKLSIKKFDSPYFRKQFIKLHEFQPSSQINLNKPATLKMPQKFESTNDFKLDVTVALIQTDIPKINEVEDDTGHQDDQTFYDEDRDIPEVAQEVMLEDTVEERPGQIPPKIVLPPLPADYPDIHIAVLQPQAPYFKITKVTDQKGKRRGRKPMQTGPPTKPTDTIQLKDGTKLVSTNPLAHLLGDRNVEDIIKTNPKYKYKPKLDQDVQGTLLQALQKLEKTAEKKPRKTKANIDIMPKISKIIGKTEIKMEEKTYTGDDRKDAMEFVHKTYPTNARKTINEIVEDTQTEVNQTQTLNQTSNELDEPLVDVFSHITRIPESVKQTEKVMEKEEVSQIIEMPQFTEKSEGKTQRSIQARRGRKKNVSYQIPQKTQVLEKTQEVSENILEETQDTPKVSLDMPVVT